MHLIAERTGGAHVSSVFLLLPVVDPHFLQL
jgi:hypothetical protein